MIQQLHLLRCIWRQIAKRMSYLGVPAMLISTLLYCTGPLGQVLPSGAVPLGGGRSAMEAAMAAQPNGLPGVLPSPAVSINIGGVGGAANGAPSAVPAAVSQTQKPASEARPTQPLDRIEFQDFVLQAIGRELPVFGADLFRESPTTFAPLDAVPPPAEYQIGPGDEIVIKGWGQVDIDLTAVVDRTGAIAIPKVGVVYLTGVRYQDLTATIRAAVARNFKNFELVANLGRLRSIQIFVLGQAKRPGSYTVSSLSSLVSGLFASGGPSIRGSMRAIQLKRGSRLVTEFDLYDLLAKGDKSKDVSLLAGDVIFIPPVGSLVAVHGSVNSPGIYELRQESTLRDLLDVAGGTTSITQFERATFERVRDRKERTVDEITLDNAGIATPLRNGDVITLYSIAPRFDNAVTLRGNVAQARRVPWRQNMRVSDVIPSVDALLSPEYWNRRNQSVGLTASISSILAHQETAGTRLSIADLNQPAKTDTMASATVVETLRRSQIEQEAARLTAIRSLERASGLNMPRPPKLDINWDYAVIERLDRANLTTALIPFNLAKAVIDRDPGNNVSLQPGDILTVFSTEEIRTSVLHQKKYVRLDGELAIPGVYEVQPGETLRQLLLRVGGFSQAAYAYGMQLTRESVRISQQKSLSEATARLERDSQRLLTEQAQNARTAEEAAAVKQQLESARGLIERLKQVKAQGRIVLSLPAESGLAQIPELVLEDGDQLYVPARPSVVHVFGAVFNENSYVFEPKRTVADYIARSGGATRDADTSSIYLMRANGSVTSRRQSGLFSGFYSEELQAGDALIVPEDLDKYSFMRGLKDFGQIFYQFGLGAAAIKILKN